MEYETKRVGNILTLYLKGRLDTLAAKDFDTKIDMMLNGVVTLFLDLKDLVYTSSSGLRVFAKILDIMEKNGEVIFKNVSPEIRFVFEMTGMLDDITIQ